MITGFNPTAVVFIVLPFSILIAHGIKYLLEKWYGLFPANPYARISALLPLTLLFGLIIFPAIMQYIDGYRYNPNVATQFSYDLNVINSNLSEGTLLVGDNYDFYKILEKSTNLIISDKAESNKPVAVLKNNVTLPEEYTLSKIITSPMRDNSDIIYLYIYSERKEGE